LGSRDFYELRNHGRNPIQVTLNTIESMALIGGAPCEPHGKLEPCEWRSKLMRDVSQQPPLACKQALQAFGCFVEGAGQITDLIAAPGMPSGRKVAAPKSLYRRRQISDRRYHPDRRSPAENSRSP